MLYDILLWDLDGTLTDPKEGITRCVQYALEQLNETFSQNHAIPESNDLLWVIGPPLYESFARLLNTSDDKVLQQALNYYRERYSQKGMYENSLYPGIAELLAETKNRGCLNILATSKPKIFADQILKHFNIYQYFEFTMGSKLNGELTDKKDLIREIFKLIKPSDSKIVMIGDRRFDVEGAKANAIDVISVGFGYGSMEELEEARPTYIVKAIDDLRELLIEK